MYRLALVGIATLGQTTLQIETNSLALSSLLLSDRMKYEDASCSWDQLEEHQSFSIERHALRINQPIERADGDLRLACPRPGGRRWGRIDFSKGFSQWWFLSHIDVKIPSEHTQEGKRYSAEVQMAHFYSVSGDVAGVDNEVSSIMIELECG